MLTQKFKQRIIYILKAFGGIVLMDNAYKETKFLIKKYGITANKNLGQNFLIDDYTINSIVEKAEINSEDLVIEIGPGLGTLTQKLLENAGKVVAVELDKKMIHILNERFFLYKNFELINDDILKVDLNKIINNTEYKRVKVVANLPYYITTSIIMGLLEQKLKIDSITVMVQKEVAERITAIPGSKKSGAISYSVYYYCVPEVLLNVERNMFIPSPEVDSQVIKLTLRKEPIVIPKDEKLFFKVIKSSFMQRRKTLVNGLVNCGIVNEKSAILEILKKLEIDENVRGEDLTIEQFCQISNLL